MSAFAMEMTSVRKTGNFSARFAFISLARYSSPSCGMAGLAPAGSGNTPRLLRRTV